MLSASNSSVRQECAPGKNVETAGRPDAPERGTYVPPGFPSRLDALMAVIRFGPAHLTGGEFLVLLFHVERSLPYGKASDSASLSQMIHGIRRRNGVVIRGGCGLKASAVKNANRSLQQKGLLQRQQRKSLGRGYEATDYRVDWQALAALFGLANAAFESAPQRQPAKPVATERQSPLGAQWPHRVQSSQNEMKQKQRSSVPLAAIPTATEFEGGKLPFAVQLSDSVGRDPSHQVPTGKRETEMERLLREEPQAVLNRLYQEREGRPISQFEWRSLRERLEMRNVPLEEFICLVLQNQGNWRSFPAGLRFLEKHYFSKTSPVELPIMPRPAALERCMHCGEPVGMGVRIEHGRLVPCLCASPEWRAKLLAINGHEAVRRKEPQRAGRDTSSSANAG